MELMRFFFEGVDVSREQVVKEAITQDPLFEVKVTKLFRQYLRVEDPLSLERTAYSIVQLLPERKSTSHSSAELATFWDLCVTVAEQIPHDHPFQLKLARLLNYLQYSNKTAASAQLGDNEKNNFAIVLHPFRETIRDSLDPAFSPGDRAETSNAEHTSRWINVNAFYANMHAQGWRLSASCTRAMKYAFISTPKTDYQALECHVVAAAQWMLYAGQSIFQSSLYPPEETVLGEEAQHWSLDTWTQWKVGFSNAANETNLMDGTRDIAKRAVTLMDVLESAWQKA
ncbi:hypothetical protein TruAng_004140 [Truncatella angustata]|nr:hypothetical protein TruAng_004140 [Truncatella angustata]